MLIWLVVVFFFKQKTAYEMRISDWSSDVCSSDLDQAGIYGSGIYPFGAQTLRIRDTIIGDASASQSVNSSRIDLRTMTPDFLAGFRVERDDVLIAGAEIKSLADLYRRSLQLRRRTRWGRPRMVGTDWLQSCDVGGRGRGQWGIGGTALDGA